MLKEYEEPMSVLLMDTDFMTHLSQDFFQFYSSFMVSPIDQKHLRYRITLKLSSLLLMLVCLSSCVVKEELGGVYNQARFGLNHWELTAGQSPDQLIFNLGYLIGLEDTEGIAEFVWRYELMTPRQEVLASHQEQMREADETKKSVFVQGQRQRILELPRALETGKRYVLWFTLFYRGERFHEQLFALESGTEGGNINWLEEWINDQSLAIDGSTNLSLPQAGTTTVDAGIMGSEEVPMAGTD